MITGLRCAVCGTTVDIATACPWACPKASPSDPYHVLHLVDDGVVPADIEAVPSASLRLKPIRIFLCSFR